MFSLKKNSYSFAKFGGGSEKIHFLKSLSFLNLLIVSNSNKIMLLKKY